MRRNTTDIVVSGGGIAGMAAAAAFGGAGFHVVCVEPHQPISDPKDAHADLRSTAFLQPARHTLQRAGLWDQLAPFATPMKTMRLADAGGETNTLRAIADFEASEISDDFFAWNLPNWLLRREMHAHLERLETVEFITGQRTRRLTARSDHALVQIGEQHYKCQLVIAADGRESPLRKMAGIGVKTWRYGQKALAFAATHDAPHDNISTEIHRSGGPFTLVPLPDHQGRPCSAVIWMETAAKASDLWAMDTADFNKALNIRACQVLGEMHLVSRRNIWPIISQKADHLTSARLALVAEAAHVVPPIGAQGLNMSLADIDCLLNLAQENPDALGTPQHLDAYEKARAQDIAMRVRGVDALNRAAMFQSPTLRDLRLQGLKSLHGFAPLRKSIMRKGLG
ncbi:2-octaprenyl-6-methoxyphenyl hydroxylase [Amylibacter marinus]|uniref:2-octaprenyl-6-methoxyphenyl hydroxylase n=1 Tax=Amylibacter marinus TaxID=1475483 RepID=A0ABQ5VTT0_9RHOB|nr:FAD-dependent monooxygenase [Amylibacter marinus]GLQ34564.1 2-octaprenyl-6-methoxyphenyl hydroxylase [Amylibacter marinus]